MATAVPIISFLANTHGGLTSRGVYYIRVLPWRYTCGVTIWYTFGVIREMEVCIGTPVYAWCYHGVIGIYGVTMEVYPACGIGVD